MAWYLTTKDNPFSPVTQFKDWYEFDMDHNYNCCGLLMRVAKISDGFSEEENDLEIERAIDSILEFDPTSNYMKVSDDQTPPGGSHISTTP